MVESDNQIKFSETERKIIPLLAYGYSQREVAEKVSKSPSNIKCCASNIIKK